MGLPLKPGIKNYELRDALALLVQQQATLPFWVLIRKQSNQHEVQVSNLNHSKLYNYNLGHTYSWAK